MEMDVKLAFFRKINNAISSDPILLSFLVDTYPDFSVRLATKGFDLLELEKIQVSISNYSSSHYQNLIIRSPSKTDKIRGKYFVEKKIC